MATIGDATLYLGDVLAVLAVLPDESVHCVVTSPPYWGLRDYGTGTWEGGSAECDHRANGERRQLPHGDGRANDSYADERNIIPGVGAMYKDLCGIPWRVAFALQADGWYLRSDIIWAKPNPMPESVTDRPTKAHEYLFLLSKSARYFYDADAVRESAEYGRSQEIGDAKIWNRSGVPTEPGRTPGNTTVPGDGAGGRNRRTVWTIATEPFPGAHFATFPRKLVEPCILAGCPRKACPKCGAPWVSEHEPTPEYAEKLKTASESWYQRKEDPFSGTGNKSGNNQSMTAAYITTGEHPTCACGLPPIPGTVLEPFLGSGTTLVVALTHGRRGIGIELKEDYFRMAIDRLRYGTVDPEAVAIAERQLPLFSEDHNHEIRKERDAAVRHELRKGDWGVEG